MKVEAPQASVLEITLQQQGAFFDFATEWAKTHEFGGGAQRGRGQGGEGGIMAVAEEVVTEEVYDQFKRYTMQQVGGEAWIVEWVVVTKEECVNIYIHIHTNWGETNHQNTKTLTTGGPRELSLTNIHTHRTHTLFLYIFILIGFQTNHQNTLTQVDRGNLRLDLLFAGSLEPLGAAFEETGYKSARTDLAALRQAVTAEVGGC